MGDARRIACLVLGVFECLLFGCTIHGWPSLVFVLHQDGIYEHLCYMDVNSTPLADNDGGTASQYVINLITMPPEVAGDIILNDNGELSSKTTDLDLNDTCNCTRPLSDSPVGPHEAGDAMTSHVLSCPERDRIFSLAYTLALLVAMTVTVIQGKMFDLFGMRVLRIFASFLFIPGVLMLAFVDKDHSWMIFPGLTFVATSGMTIIITNNHLSMLAGSRKSTIATVYSGAVDCSIWVFLVVKVLWEKGVSRKVSLGVFAASWIVVIIDTFFLYPKVKVNWPWTSAKVTRKDDVSKARVSVYLETPSLTYCLTSPVYYLHVAWFCMTFLRVVCFFSFFNAWISDMTNYDMNRVSSLTNTFSYMLFCGILFTPLLGLTMDWCKKRLFTTTYDLVGNALAAMPALYFTCAMGVLVSISVLLPYEVCVYFSFFFFVVFKTSVFSVFYAFFNLALPQMHYGMLVGIAMAIGGVLAMVQYPLMVWVDTSSMGFVPANLVLLGLSVLSLIHPTNLTLMNRRKKAHYMPEDDYVGSNNVAMKFLNPSRHK